MVRIGYAADKLPVFFWRSGVYAFRAFFTAGSCTFDDLFRERIVEKYNLSRVPYSLFIESHSTLHVEK